MAKTIRTMLMIILAIIVVAGLGVGGYWYLKHKKSGAPKPLTATQLQQLRVDLPENTTNLQDGLIQFTLSLQADNASTKKELTELQPSVQDAVNEVMKTFTQSQLHSVAGLSELKSAIKQAVDSRLPSGKITDVFFATIVIQ